MRVFIYTEDPSDVISVHTDMFNLTPGYEKDLTPELQEKVRELLELAGYQHAKG